MRHRGASPLRKRRAVGQPVYLSPSFAPRRPLPALRSERTGARTCCSRARATQFVAGRRRIRAGEGKKERRRRCEEASGRSREKRSDETRREGKEAGKKGEGHTHRPRTALHADTAVSHAHGPRKPGERARKREKKKGKDRVSRWRFDGRHSQSSPTYVGGAAGQPRSSDGTSPRRPRRRTCRPLAFLT